MTTHNHYLRITFGDAVKFQSQNTKKTRNTPEHIGQLQRSNVVLPPVRKCKSWRTFMFRQSTDQYVTTQLHLWQVLENTSLKNPPEIKTQQTRDVKLKFIPHCPSQTMRDGFLETSAPWREGMAWKLLGCYNFKQGRLAVAVLVGGYSETRMVDYTTIRRGDGWEWDKTPRAKLRSGMWAVLKLERYLNYRPRQANGTAIRIRSLWRGQI
jgi:hypothetical protein